MCGGAYHPVNGYVHSAFAAANDAKHCNYWINDGTGDGFSSHLHAAAQSKWVADARMDRGMRCVTIEPRFSISAAKSEEWVLTSLVLLIGFSILLLASLKTVFYFGLFSVIAVVAVLYGDIILLTLLLKKWK